MAFHSFQRTPGKILIKQARSQLLYKRRLES